ncbi:MAG: recombinase family protein [Deltaproteobacteria bacterium]|nr:recombinase family protein [Deltaproteobacteria bacterium]
MKDQVYGYIRVSTVRQGLKGVSLQEQKCAIERYAESHQLTIIQWFEEKETAAKQGRPIFSKMLRMLRDKKASGVIIHKIDRSARNLKDWSSLGELIDCGVDVHFAHESLDLKARGGRLSADIQAVIAADYIRNLREETIKGMYGRLKQGYYPFCAPLGYVNNGSGQPKTQDPLVAPLIWEAYEKYSWGEISLSQLKIYLAKKGLRHKNGRKVSVNGLSRILRNPFYMGIIHIQKNEETFIGNHQPIVSKSLFDKVQNVLDGKVKKGSSRNQFIYRRLFQCRSCNYSTVGEIQKGHVYYRCHSHACKGTCVKEEKIEEKVKSTFANLNFDKSEEKIIDEVLEELRSENESLEVDTLKRLELQKNAISDRLDSLTDKYVDGDLEREDFLRRKRTCLGELKDLEEQIKNYGRKKQVKFQDMLKKLELSKSLYSGFILADQSQKREMVRIYTSNRFIDVKKVLMELKSPFKELAQIFNGAYGTPARGGTRTRGKLLETQISTPARGTTRTRKKLPESKSKEISNKKQIIKKIFSS